MNLSDRINAVYRTHTGATKDRGARTWFAKTLRVDVRSVTRWCDGSQTFDGTALTCLELLEQSAENIQHCLGSAAGSDGGTASGAREQDFWRSLAELFRVRHIGT